MKHLLPLGFIVSCCTLTPVPAAFPNLRLKLVVEKQIQSPTSMANAHDGSGRLFICDQRGKIHIFRNGVLLPEPFLDVGSKLVEERAGFDERGLLGLAFHPQYGQAGQPGTGRFYIFYSATSPNAPGPAEAPVNCRSVVAEFRVSAGNPNVADLSSERILLSFDKPQFNHNGGQVDFGPDGFLYFSTGDGGSSNDNNAGHTGGAASPRPTNALGNSQDKSNWMGKIFRINPLGTTGPGGQYGIPADNPFVGVAGAREEIWAFGLRNPWRFSFDRTTGRLFCADVGQGEIEEVDIIERGGNYGWRNREGTFVPTFSIDAPPLTGTVIDPIAQYAHPNVVKGMPPLPQLGVSITGGFLYRGAAIPAMQGKYLFGDFSQVGAEPKGTMLGLEEAGGVWSLSVLNVDGGNPIGRFIQAFGEDEAGEVFVGGKSTVAVSALDNGFPAGSLLQVVASPVPITVVLPASKDNSIYSEGPFSNALGLGLFAGRTGHAPDSRRGLIKFDLSGLPAGSTIQSASLALTITKSPDALNRAFAFHRLTRDWGEATSQASGEEGSGAAATTGDATWAAPLHGTLPGWTTPGGDFVAAASSTATAGGSGRVTWSGLAADVQHFVDHPEANFGWILVGDENASLTARRFASRQHTFIGPADRPALSVTYLPGEVLTHRQKWERQHYFIGQFVDNAADIDGDGQSTLVEYGWNRSPKQSNAIGNAFRLAGTTANALEIRFWRDPLAIDLTYILETSATLATWQAAVTSAAGAAPTGASFLNEIDAPGQPGLKEVVCSIPKPPDHQFVRLRLTSP